MAIHIVPVRPRRSSTIAVNCVLAYATARQESNTLQQQIGIVKNLGDQRKHFVNLGSKPLDFRPATPLYTWPPHHSGAHRSDTLALLHPFGRHHIPPRAYTLHQERSKQQGKRRESVKESTLPLPPHLKIFFPSSSSSTSQAAPCRRLARNCRPAVIVPRSAESKYSRNRRGKSVLFFWVHAQMSNQKKPRISLN